jgi:hypothetical protein
MKITFLMILIWTMVQYLINIIIAYRNLPKYAKVSKFIKELRDTHWCIWVPILGFALQIAIAAVIIYTWSIQKIKNIRIK